MSGARRRLQAAVRVAAQRSLRLRPPALPLRLPLLLLLLRLLRRLLLRRRRLRLHVAARGGGHVGALAQPGRIVVLHVSGSIVVLIPHIALALARGTRARLTASAAGVVVAGVARRAHLHHKPTHPAHGLRECSRHLVLLLIACDVSAATHGVLLGEMRVATQTTPTSCILCSAVATSSPSSDSA